MLLEPESYAAYLQCNNWIFETNFLWAIDIHQLMATEKAQITAIPPRANLFLWGTFKNKIFNNTLENIVQLEQRITMETGSITQVTLKSLQKNLLRYTLICKTQLGTHFQHLL